MSELIVMFWLMGLTLAQVVSAAALMGIRRRWDSLENREETLGHAERIERLNDLLQRHRGHLDKDIHKAAYVLLVALENDPNSADRHFLAIQALKAKLAQA